MTSPFAPLRDAATVLVLREGPTAPEVLMLRRHGRSGFAADAWVFPGGTVDDGDCTLDPARWKGIDPTELTARFESPGELVLGYHVAAVRETFEEAGLLLAQHADGRRPAITDPAYVGTRAAMADREADTDFNSWLDSEDLVLDLGSLTYLSRWVTPVIERKRYDTCFFFARAPEDQVAEHDRVEITDQRWLTAAEALERAAEGSFLLWPPTEHSLRGLLAFAHVDECLAHARAQPEVPTIQPHIEVGEGGDWRALLPDDPDYPRHLYAPGGELAGSTRVGNRR